MMDQCYENRDVNSGNMFEGKENGSDATIGVPTLRKFKNIHPLSKQSTQSRYFQEAGAWCLNPGLGRCSPNRLLARCQSFSSQSQEITPTKAPEHPTLPFLDTDTKDSGDGLPDLIKTTDVRLAC